MEVFVPRKDLNRVLGTRCSRNEQSARCPILCKWMYPSAGLVAINCDTSYRASKNNGDYCVIIRDEMGRVMMTKSSQFPIISIMDEHKASNTEYGMKVLMLEMIAIHDGLQLAKSLGFTAVEVRSDSQSAIAILAGLASCPEDCCQIVSEINDERFFRVLGFVFIYRECNRAADFLSRFMSDDGARCMDHSELPQTLQRIV